MKQVLMALVIAAFAYTGAEAQTKMVCKPVAVKHATTVHHKSVTQTTKTTSTTTACRMLPFQVCTILPDRRSVSCTATTDNVNETPTGATTIYGPTGAMPGEPVHFKVRTIVIKGDEKGSYCKRNVTNDATVCYRPGYLIRDENGYYSYGEALSTDEDKSVSVKSGGMTAK